MKIGILTYHRSHNYGAFLQSYALCKTIQQITDCQVEIIDYNMEVAQMVNKEVINFNRRNPESLLYNYLKYRMFERNKERLPISEYSLVTDDMDKFKEFIENNYNIVIVGSDEVWKVDGFRGFPNPYWLPQVTGIKKLSYAASSRTRYEDISPDNISKLKNMLQILSILVLEMMRQKNYLNRLLIIVRRYM